METKGRAAKRRMAGSCLMAMLAAVAACGGSGSDAPRDDGRTGIGKSADFANFCAPDNPQAFGADGASRAPAGQTYRTGSREQEQRFLRALMDEVYLWNDEIPQVDAALPTYRAGPHAIGMARYLDALKSPARLADGQLRDRFTGVMTQEDWDREGVEASRQQGFGARIGRLSREGEPLVLAVITVDQGSPARQKGVKRGERLISVKTGPGEEIVVASMTEAQRQRLRQLLNAPEAGASLTMRLQAPGAAAVREVRLEAATYVHQFVAEARVHLLWDGAQLGYLMLDGFGVAAEGQLATVVQRMKQIGVRDLVVDLRYNTGGIVRLASQLAYMVADPVQTRDRVFQNLRFNPGLESQLGDADRRMPFLSVSSGETGSGIGRQLALPNLGLSRVYVLTGANTCSASEAFINGLQGVDVEVVQIGERTCGKPYVYKVQPNCGMVYLPMMARAENAKGRGDYDGGLVPTCTVADDFGHDLGNRNEALLAAALHHRQYGRCPATAAVATRSLPGAAPAGRERATLRLLNPVVPAAGLVDAGP